MLAGESKSQGAEPALCVLCSCPRYAPFKNRLGLLAEQPEQRRQPPWPNRWTVLCCLWAPSTPS